MPFFRALFRWLRLLAGLAGIWLAIQGWIWFSRVPSSSYLRRCGNCFLAAAGTPLELGLLGLLLVFGHFAKAPPVRHGMALWICAVAGIALTPDLIGAPLFLLGYLWLALPVAKAFLRLISRAPGNPAPV